MPGLIGKKLGMTSIYSAEGKNLPCTLIECGPCVVTQVKTVEKDGYSAVQLGYGERKEKNTPNALKGHFKKAGTSPKSKFGMAQKVEVMLIWMLMSGLIPIKVMITFTMLYLMNI